MTKVGNYDIYQTGNYQNYDNKVQNYAQRDTAKTEKTQSASKPQQTELSQGAKNVLKELQQKYGNMDFIVGSYETEEEAAEYLSRGTKEYSVLLDPEELEKMAADKNAKKEQMNQIEMAVGQLANMKAQLGEEGATVKNLGVSIGKDGKTTLFASLEEMGEKQKERLEEAKEAKAADKAAEKKAASGKVKKTFVKADNTTDLLEKIRTVDWDKIEAEDVPVSGSKIDYFG